MRSKLTILRGGAEGGIAGSVALGAAVLALLGLRQVSGAFDAGLVPFSVYVVVAGVCFSVILWRFLDNSSVAVAGLLCTGLLVGTVLTAIVLERVIEREIILLYPSMLFTLHLAVAVVLVSPAATGDRGALSIWLAAGWAASLCSLVAVATFGHLSPAPLVDYLSLPEVGGALDVVAILFLAIAFFPAYVPTMLPVAGAFYGAGLRAVETPDRPPDELFRFLSGR